MFKSTSKTVRVVHEIFCIKNLCFLVSRSWRISYNKQQHHRGEIFKRFWSAPRPQGAEAALQIGSKTWQCVGLCQLVLILAARELQEQMGHGKAEAGCHERPSDVTAEAEIPTAVETLGLKGWLRTDEILYQVPGLEFLKKDRKVIGEGVTYTDPSILETTVPLMIAKDSSSCGIEPEWAYKSSDGCALCMAEP